jgi:hypothetical protein
LNTDLSFDHSVAIQSFWYAGPLSDWEKACLLSFAKKGYSVHLYTYDVDLQLPEGVIRRDAAEILPQSDVFFYQQGPGKGSVAAFANCFRYELLRQRGGWWVDTDVYCLSRLPQSSGEAIVGLETSSGVNNAVIYAPPGHRLMELAAGESRRLGRNVKWGASGPLLLSRLCLGPDSGGDVRLMGTGAFYPLHFREVLPLLLRPGNSDLARSRCAEASTLHLYNEIFRRCRIDKDRLPPKGSYLHELFLQAMPELKDSEAHNAWKLRVAEVRYSVRNATPYRIKSALRAMRRLARTSIGRAKAR